MLNYIKGNLLYLNNEKGGMKFSLRPENVSRIDTLYVPPTGLYYDCNNYEFVAISSAIAYEHISYTEDMFTQLVPVDFLDSPLFEILDPHVIDIKNGTTIFHLPQYANILNQVEDTEINDSIDVYLKDRVKLMIDDSMYNVYFDEEDEKLIVPTMRERVLPCIYKVYGDFVHVIMFDGDLNIPSIKGNNIIFRINEYIGKDYQLSLTNMTPLIGYSGGEKL